MNEQNNHSESFDFENHRLQAIEKYQKVRPLYGELSGVVKNILSEVFNAHRIKTHSIEARAKEIESFGNKASSPSQDDISRLQYPNPLPEITDLAGVRVITFFPKTLGTVDNVIRLQFDVIEKPDKTQILIKEEKLGYGSIHYLVHLKDDRTNLPEYSRFKNLVAEIQVRTILQHAWAKIEGWLSENEDKKGKRGNIKKSNITDNESAKMPSSHGVIQGYNGIAAADSKHQVIVHAEAFGEGHEGQFLKPMIEGIRKNFSGIEEAVCI